MIVYGISIYLTSSPATSRHLSSPLILSPPLPSQCGPTTIAAGDRSGLASERSTAFGGISDVPSPSSSALAPIRASPSGSVTETAGYTASNDAPAMGVGSNIPALFVFVLFVLPLWALSHLAPRRTHGVRRQSRARSRGRPHLPARRVPGRRGSVFRGGYWALALFLGGGRAGQHLLVEASHAEGHSSTMTDTEFKTASWGTFN